MIHSALEKKRGNTSQGFGAFFAETRGPILVPVLSLFLMSFSFFLIFITITVVEFFNKNNYSTRACWISNDYNQLCATRLVGYLSFDIQRALVE